MGAFSKIISRLRITSDPNVTTQTSAVIQADSANSNLVISPSGTGAIVAQAPDGTATGGNARGANAVDLQMYRTNSNQVARGGNDVIAGGGENRNGTGAYQTIGGGSQNFANGVYTTISGGLANNAGNNYVFIGGGNANNGSGGQYTTIPGGRSNTASSDNSTVSGGQSNIASTGTHATVVGGQSNTSSGQHSVSGGTNNTASGSEASIALGMNNNASGFRSVTIGQSNTASGLSAISLGRQNQATGQYSFIGGGEYNQATANYSVAFGQYALANQFGAITNANGYFQYTGDAQVVNLLARKQASLTTGATTKLSLDGTGTTNLINFGLDSSMAISFLVTIKWSAGINNANGAAGISNDDCITQTDQIMMKKLRSGALSLVGTTSTLVTKGDASMTTSAMNYSVSGNSELVLNYQAPTFASGGPITVRVLASIEVVSLITAPF